MNIKKDEIMEKVSNHIIELTILADCYKENNQIEYLKYSCRVLLNNFKESKI